MLKRFLFISLLTFFASPVAAKPLVADLSEYNIAINTDFSGKNLILFGARQAAGDVVVVVRGPERDYTLHQKKRVAGIWVNRHHLELQAIPSYYAIASTKPLNRSIPNNIEGILQLGLPHLPYPETDEGYENIFVQAFIHQQRREGLYVEQPGSITFLGDTLFKTTLPFPDVTPRGNYTVETYLFHDKQLVAVQSMPLHVAKTGLDASIFYLAHEKPALYGMIAVFIAIFAGWGASAIFGNRRL